MPRNSASSPLTAVIEIGTSWMLASRFCAVTTISSTPRNFVSATGATGSAAGGDASAGGSCAPAEAAESAHTSTASVTRRFLSTTGSPLLTAQKNRLATVRSYKDRASNVNGA